MLACLFPKYNMKSIAFNGEFRNSQRKKTRTAYQFIYLEVFLMKAIAEIRREKYLQVP